jgi:hypothetical protein
VDGIDDATSGIDGTRLTRKFDPAMPGFGIGRYQYIPIISSPQNHSPSPLSTKTAPDSTKTGKTRWGVR